jgi:hypothetical protein
MILNLFFTFTMRTFRASSILASGSPSTPDIADRGEGDAFAVGTDDGPHDPERAARLACIEIVPPFGVGRAVERNRGAELDRLRRSAAGAAPLDLAVGFVPDFVIAWTWMPVDRPWVMSNIWVTSWNSAIDSRLNFGWPYRACPNFCVTCWPSRLS